MPANQRPPNPLPGSPLFDTCEDARAWVDQNRPKVPVAYYRQHGTTTYAVEELRKDHPLRRGAIVMTVGRPASPAPKPELEVEEPELADQDEQPEEER